ncbi:hypothetical protein EDC01DRAFT_634867 [Geopyxis carbonaria]|nr:hypothetical protein EDC01DRAFT_634867 [Geopyxis carbonaria]
MAKIVVDLCCLKNVVSYSTVYLVIFAYFTALLFNMSELPMSSTTPTANPGVELSSDDIDNSLYDREYPDADIENDEESTLTEDALPAIATTVLKHNPDTAELFTGVQEEEAMRMTSQGRGILHYWFQLLITGVKIPQHEILNAHDTLVRQVSTEIYYRRGEQALFQISDVRLLNARWVVKDTHHNNSSTIHNMGFSYTEGLSTTQGTETSLEWNIGANFRGLSLGIGGSTRSFSSTEVSSGTTRSREMPVPPQTSMRLYQLQYNFRVVIWFILDAWNARWGCGHRGRNVLIRLETRHTIASNETVGTAQRLSGSTRMPLQALPPPHIGVPPVRKFENLTTLARNTLLGRGVNPA